MTPEYGPERTVNAVSRRLSCTQKAERLLGFRASVSLEEGVRRFVTWWEANKDRFTS
jgi:UDP-glucose 4-epimerase